MSASCPAGTAVLDCQDLYSIIIQAILNLGGAQGSTAAAIYSYLPTICSNASAYTEAAVNTAISTAAARGILFRVFANTAATPTYMVNAYMKNFNPRNSVYSRYPRQCNSFFRCG